MIHKYERNDDSRYDDDDCDDNVSHDKNDFSQEMPKTPSVTKICTIWFMCKKVSALFFLHFTRPTLKLTSCWSRLLWCSGIDAENWEFAKVVLATTTYFRTPIVLWVWTNSRGPHHQPHNPLTSRRDWESRPTAQFLKREKSAQLWCVRTAVVCKTALQQRGLFKPAHIIRRSSKGFRGLEITTIQLSALLTLRHLSHRWIRWVGLKLLCFVLLPSAAMLFRPDTQRCCCPSGTPRLGLAGAGGREKTQENENVKQGSSLSNSFPNCIKI